MAPDAEDTIDIPGPDETSQIIDAAERLRPELPVLLPDDGAAVAAELSALIARVRALPAGEEREAMVDELLSLLTSWPRTRARLHDLLPVSWHESARSYQPLAGNPHPGYDRYVCPTCKDTWVILDADEDEQAPTTCTTDGAALEFTAAGDG